VISTFDSAGVKTADDPASRAQKTRADAAAGHTSALEAEAPRADVAG
jgi:hypothetical protein